MIINESKLNESTTMGKISDIMEKAGISFDHGDVMEWSNKNDKYIYEFSCEASINRINKAVDALKKEGYITNLRKQVYDGLDFYTLEVTEKPKTNSSSSNKSLRVGDSYRAPHPMKKGYTTVFVATEVGSNGAWGYIKNGSTGKATFFSKMDKIEKL